MKRSIARFYMARAGTPRWMQWVALALCEPDTPRPRWHRALTVAGWAMVAAGVLLLLTGPVWGQEARHWYAERVVCLPMSDVPWIERCGVSRIGPFAEDRCSIDGAAAWTIERERLVRAGWGGLEFPGPVACVYRGPVNSVS